VDLLTLAWVVLRRWYITVPVLVGTALIAAYLQTQVPPQYEARGAVLLESPEANPADLPISLIELDALAAIVAAEASSGAADDVEVQTTSATSADILVTAPTARQAQSAMSGIVSQLTEAIVAVQDGADVPEADRVRLTAPPGLAPTDMLDDESFQAAVSVTVFDPAAQVNNPYPPGGTTAQLLEIAVTSDAGRARVAELTGTGVGFSLSTSSREGSIIDITTLGSDPNAVREAFEPVRAVMAEELQVRQDRAEVPRSRHIGVEVLAAPQSAVDVSPPIDRAVAATVALGGLLAIALAISFDGVASRRRRPSSGDDRPSAAPWPDDAIGTRESSLRDGPDYRGPEASAPSRRR
jgi:hypothetical protein